ncbi:uncharacterized protein LOC117580824 [Drosophila guanche]|uniref:Blast:HMG box-containing protein 4 n=1 Tax=Drosophila guanche TaxID=7266 RepID=A0A3B0JXB3_DROGU|nr:uncharacterized protein LOC117580824 [Drosophila guanche]SPP78399.1 blast:HMG box-containing protein 4 [Drosophila guanche]
MESPTFYPVAKDFQVTGISRSGRVRKKSSKLLDFESPEEVEKKARRGQGRPPARYPGRGRPPNALREREAELERALEQDMLFDDHNLSDSELHIPAPTMGIVLMNSDDELDNLVQDLVDGVEAEATNNESTMRQSLYMREKTNSRKMLKAGKVVTGKPYRKDKGKTRYTAYSLWAREIRKRDFQDLDFSNAARRLSELWANVSNREKIAWRRKAKVQSTKARAREKNGLPPLPTASNGGTTAAEPPAPEGNFMNRATTSRTRKLAADRLESATPTMPATTATGGPRRNTTRSCRGRRPSATNRSSAGKKPTPVLHSPSDTELSPGAGTGTGSQREYQLPAEKSNIAAIDAAAHLKLLGESLTVIGERLKKHNGHVALSGSLSVLLDSLLCSMGPLLCMTTQIPGLENKPQLRNNLANTLDNIAYVMPGL